MKNNYLFICMILFTASTFFHISPDTVHGQAPPAATPTIDPAAATATPTAIPPTETPTPSPTPYTNPAGKQPPGLGGGAKQRSISRAQAMLGRIQQAITRLDVMWTRVQAMIATFGSQGKDITPLAGASLDVQAKRQAVVDAVTAAQASLAQLNTAKNPGKTGKAALVQLHAVKQALKAYHQSIVNVIRNIKGMSGNTGIFPTATPTATPIPSPTETLTPTPTVLLPTSTSTPGP